MMAFEQIAEREAPDNVKRLPDRNRAEEASAAMQLLLISLGALSKRVLIALSSLFTLLTVGSAFWLWMATPEPTILQIISLGMYGVFILAINYIARR